MEKLNRCRLGSDCDEDEPENEHTMMMMAMIMIVVTMIGIVMAMILAIVMTMIMMMMVMMMMVMTRTRTTIVNDVLVMFLLPAVVCGRSMSRSPGRGPMLDQSVDQRRPPDQKPNNKSSHGLVGCSLLIVLFGSSKAPTVRRVVLGGFRVCYSSWGAVPQDYAPAQPVKAPGRTQWPRSHLRRHGRREDEAGRTP